MRSIRATSRTALAAILLALPLPLLAQDESDRSGENVVGENVVGFNSEGFRPLFNGEDLSGWEQKNGTAEYEVEDGAVLGTTAEGSPNSFLCTTEEYGDFILTFQVKVDPRLNSGVQIRSNTKDGEDGRVFGYQVEIDSDGDSGYIYGEATGRGWLSTDREDQVERGAFRVDEWNSYVVICEGDRIQTFVNGYPVADLTDDMEDSGFIGLQVHSFRGDSPAQVRWKNIYIKEL